MVMLQLLSLGDLKQQSIALVIDCYQRCTVHLIVEPPAATAARAGGSDAGTTCFQHEQQASKAQASTLQMQNFDTSKLRNRYGTAA